MMKKNPFTAVRNSHRSIVHKKNKSNVVLKLSYFRAEDLSDYFFALDASSSIIMYILFAGLFHYTTKLIVSYLVLAKTSRNPECTHGHNML